MISIDIDLSELQKFFNAEVVEAVLQQAATDLIDQTHEKVLELARDRLKTRLSKFKAGIKVYQEDGVWIIALDDDLAWINDGVAPGSMLPGLLGGKSAHTAKDGHKYAVVPFPQAVGSGPTNTTDWQMDLVKNAKKAVKKAGLKWAELELDDQGRPKVGLLHKLTVTTPNKGSEGPGQGWGKIGDPRVGKSGTQFMQGASVYQREVKDRASGVSSIQRGVVTFRIASEKHAAEGKWMFPGLEKTNIFEDAYAWAVDELERSVQPQINEKIADLAKG
jgi:hypothetical protein